MEFKQINFYFVKFVKQFFIKKQFNRFKTESKISGCYNLILCLLRTSVKSAYQKNNFCISQPKHMGAQKNSLNETVLLSTKNMFKLMGKKYLLFYAQKLCLSKPVLSVGP